MGESFFARATSARRRANPEKLTTMYLSPDERAALARDEAATKAIAINAGWRQEALLEFRRSASPFPAYIPDADLLLAPMTRLPNSPPDIAFAMGLIRSDALLVGVGRDRYGLTGVYGKVGLWGRREVAWRSELRAWCSDARELWFASEPHVSVGDQIGFHLSHRRLSEAPPPWNNEADKLAGFARAERMILGREVR